VLLCLLVEVEDYCLKAFVRVRRVVGIVGMYRYKEVGVLVVGKLGTLAVIIGAIFGELHIAISCHIDLNTWGLGGEYLLNLKTNLEVDALLVVLAVNRTRATGTAVAWIEDYHALLRRCNK
jgi:hypothetical protein